MRKTIATHVPVLIVGADGTVEYANAAAYRLLGYQPGALCGLPIERLSPPARWSELGPVHAVFDGEQGCRIQSQALRADGRILDVAMTIEPSLDNDARVVGAVVSCNPLPPWHAAS